ncbi:uncharacterized protein LOC144685768 [Cetorhinus maximus]
MKLLYLADRHRLNSPEKIPSCPFQCPVISVRGSEVQGFLGQSVTLPCRYSVGENGETEMCWGRGRCSLLDCSQSLIRTNGKTVTSAISTKYHLDGKIEEGDVSLTVDNLLEEDSGLYCCRVEITGLFPDQKDHFNLLILEGSSIQPPSPSSVSLTTGHGNHFTSNATEGITKILNSAFTISPDETSSSSQPIDVTSPPSVNLLVCICITSLAIVIILTGITTFILKKKQKEFTKDESGTTTIGLHIQQAVEENVYSIQ